MKQPNVLHKNFYNIYALHGFLGEASHWNGFTPSFHGINLFDIEGESLWEFAKAFNQKITTSNNILLGYSMGGRLSLHALIDAPEKWKAAIIVSAHPGLQNDAEKKMRLEHDLNWLERFSDKNDDTVIEDWNNQAVFLKKPFKLRSDYSKEMLLRSLQNFSLGNQEDLREAISSLKMPLLWIAGKLDSKYVSISKEIVLAHKKSKIWIAANSGHRVPWEVKKEFELKLKTFLEDL